MNVLRTLVWAAFALFALALYRVTVRDANAPGATAIDQIAVGCEGIFTLLVSLSVAVAVHAATWWKPAPRRDASPVKSAP